MSAGGTDPERLTEGELNAMVRGKEPNKAMAEEQDLPSQADLNDEPLPEGYLDRPHIRAAIDEATARIRAGKIRPGKTAAQLRADADERARLESRSHR